MILPAPPYFYVINTRMDQRLAASQSCVYVPSSLQRTVRSISSWSGSYRGSSATYLTQVPQLLERFLGTGIVLASMPLDLQRRSNLIEPKCIKNVAIYVFMAKSPFLTDNST